MNNLGNEKIELWNKEDGFYYDVLHLPDGKTFPMKLRSMVGLIPLFAVGNIGLGTDRSAAAFQASHAMVHREPTRLQPPHRNANHTMVR